MTDDVRMFCPIRRDICRTAEVCWLINCSSAMARRTREKPIPESKLSKEERYALFIKERDAKAAQP